MSTGKVSLKAIIVVVAVITIALAFFWLHSNALEFGFTPSSPLCGICH